MSSDLFQRAPGVAQVLAYVCEQYFAGGASSLKEYSIAVDALHRPADFNQKHDSIVRVEVLRLRKKLQQYYESEGVDHAIRITVPKGQYTPQFTYASSPPEPAETPDEPRALVTTVEWSPRLSLPGSQAPAGQTTQLARLAGFWHTSRVLVLALALAAAAFVFWQASRAVRSRQGALIAETAGMPPLSGSMVRIQAGAPGIRIDPSGILWRGDSYFTGGNPVRLPVKPVANTVDPALYSTAREGSFRYDIPVQPGVYEVHLHFAERSFGENSERAGGEGSRQFMVKLNGATILPEVDIFSDAGGQDVAHEKVFRDVQPAADSKIHLEFLVLKEAALLNAIEVLPGVPGRMRAIRIAAGNGSVMDSKNRPWVSDRYVTGGQTTQRPETVQGTSDPQLFQAERYGHFTYTIPVDPKGKYQVKMMFSERWFGPGRPGGGGAGSRRFNILCNGVALVRNLDLYEQAGGSNRAIVRTFSNLEPTASGQLVLSFLPSANYASINALEVMEQ